MFEIQPMGLFEMQVLVSIMLVVFPCCVRWFQRPHACGVSKMNLTKSDLSFFLAVMRQIVLGFPKLVHLEDLFSQSSSLTVVGEECGRTRSPSRIFPDVLIKTHWLGADS